MNIEPVAVFHSALKEKFGIPRQSGLVDTLRGEVAFLPGKWSPEAFRGLDGFDYVWLIWGFSLNEGLDTPETRTPALTVRPPRLGGAQRLGVYATRSPFRPNPLGLSSVRLTGIDPDRGILQVLGADLAEGTPVFDVKPYLPYTDSHPQARAGFTDEARWTELEVVLPEALTPGWSEEERAALRGILAQDPRPAYRREGPDTKMYALSFGAYNVHFSVTDGTLRVSAIDAVPPAAPPTASDGRG